MGALNYYYEIIRNICHPHHTRLVTSPKIIEKNYVFTDKLKSDWYQLFDISDKKIYIPFTYHLKETDATLSFFDLLNQYDLSLAHVLHVKSSLWLGNSELILGQKYSVQHTVADVLPIYEDRICLIIRSSIFDINGNHIQDVKNAFMIKGLSAHDAHLFDQLHHNPKHNPELFKGLSKKASVLANDANIKKLEIYIPAHSGVKYGALSGDMNPIHTNAFIAKLTGAKGAFVQGLYTINLALANFIKSADLPLEKINITFCRKVYENQTISLVWKDSYYEILDTNKELLAFGRIHTLPSLRAQRSNS